MLFLIAATVVLATYAVRWYELGNAAGGGTPDRKKLSMAEAAFSLVTEIGAVFVSILLYPFAYITRDTRYSDLSPGDRPIVLCHGYMHNKSAFFLMEHRLRRAGRKNIVALNFRPSSREVPYFAERLSEAVDRALEHTGGDKVDLIGHSMGGVVVRYYIEKLGGAARVNVAVQLGAPNGGSKMAVFGVLQSAEQFKADSDLITGFQSSGAVPSSMTALWSEFDSVILPPENARLPEPAANKMIPGVGHVTLIYSGRVFDEILRALSGEDLRRESENGLS
jgi:triacylglycerol esterase/lipase EstA (alpha/beta hydrolase family)